MTQERIQRQIEVLEIVTAEICKSKESAHRFLVEAGIVKERKKRKPSKPSARKKK
jgi:hypothetical protein